MVSSNGSIQLLRAPLGHGRALQYGPGADKESSILAYLLEEGKSHALILKIQQLTTCNRLWYASSGAVKIAKNTSLIQRDNRGHLLHGRCWYVYFPIHRWYIGKMRQDSLDERKPEATELPHRFSVAL